MPKHDAEPDDRPEPTDLSSLRAMIERVERRAAPRLAPPSVEQIKVPKHLPFEVADVDAALQGGLDYDVLHEVLPARTEWDDGLTTAFCASVLARRQQEDQKHRAGQNQAAPLFWIAQHDTTGAGLSAQGLVALGLDPEALWLVKVRNDAEALWAFEEILDHPDALGVVCEVCQLELPATHRLNLRAADTAREDRGRVLLTLRRHKGARRPQANPTAAATRWRLSSIPPQMVAPNGHGKTGMSQGHRELRRPAEDAAALSLGPTGVSVKEDQAAFALGPATPAPSASTLSPPVAQHNLRRVRWRAELFRQRGGSPASWLLEWSHETHRFRRLSELRPVGPTRT